jgi:hypothetical protein
LIFTIGFRARESIIIFKSFILPRISRDNFIGGDSKDPIGSGVPGVALGVSNPNTGGAGRAFYNSDKDEEGRTSIVSPII